MDYLEFGIENAFHIDLEENHTLPSVTEVACSEDTCSGREFRGRGWVAD